MKPCIFCSCNSDEILFENELSFVTKDYYPVNKGHLLIIPKRHVENYFDISPNEKIALFELVDKAKQYLEQQYSPDGYNLGINVGEAAGQSIMHVHIHLIPRYWGDTPNPKGGVRGVIPHKQSY